MDGERRTPATSHVRYLTHVELNNSAGARLRRRPRNVTTHVTRSLYRNKLIK